MASLPRTEPEYPIQDTPPDQADQGVTTTRLSEEDRAYITRRSRERVSSRERNLYIALLLIFILLCLASSALVATNLDEVIEEADRLTDELNDQDQQEILGVATEIATQIILPSPTPQVDVTPVSTPTQIPLPQTLQDLLRVSARADETHLLSNGVTRLQEHSFPEWVNAYLEAMGIDAEGTLDQNRLFRYVWMPPTDSQGRPTDVHLGIDNKEFNPEVEESLGLNFRNASPDGVERASQQLRDSITRQVLPSGEVVFAIELDSLRAGLGLVGPRNPEDDTYYRAYAQAEDIREMQVQWIQVIAGIILEADNERTISRADAVTLATTIVKRITDRHWTNADQEPLRLKVDNELVQTDGFIDSPEMETCLVELAPDQQTADGAGDRNDQKTRLRPGVTVDNLDDQHSIQFDELDAQDQHAWFMVVDLNAIKARWSEAESLAAQQQIILSHLQVIPANLVTTPIEGISPDYEVTHTNDQSIYEAVIYWTCGVDQTPPVVQPTEQPVFVITPTAPPFEPTPGFTPQPTPENIKSPPGDQVDPDGETEPPPTGAEIIIDGEIDTDGDGDGDIPDDTGSGR